MSIFDPRSCALGEGPLWHPERKTLFWFDILNRRLMSEGREWVFDEMVSAAGWVDRDTLLIASESRLFRFDLETGRQQMVMPLEAEDRGTRSNDGRADPMGGFWIGTMAKDERQGAGAFYRYYRGALRQLFTGITVTNSLCFAPDGRRAYFSDTVTHQIMQVALDTEGWPLGAPELLLDFTKKSRYPDGAVTDAAGNLWVAFWGRGCVEGFDLTGQSLGVHDFPCVQTTCPAFGGDDYRQLYCTSAAVGLSLDGENDGQCFTTLTSIQGKPEPKVLL